MGCCKFKICCCCCSTRTGSLIIGTLGWIFTTFTIFGLLFPPFKYQSRVLNDDETDPDIKFLLRVFAAITDNENYYYYRVAVSTLTLILCIMLVTGVYKKDTKLILPWLVLKSMEIISMFIALFIIFFVPFYMDDHAFVVAFRILFVMFLLMLSLEIYLFLCVLNYYKEIEEFRNNPGTIYYTEAARTPPPVYSPEGKPPAMV